MKIEIVVPVFNEEERLAESLPKLHQFVAGMGLPSWRILIANNGSTDRTHEVAEQLRRRFAGVEVVWIPKKGRGGALKKIWLGSEADILAYMDVDLAAGLQGFPALVQAVASGEGDLAIGSRLLPGSKTHRSLRRELISRCYLALAKVLCGVTCSDTQCGFKAMSRVAAQALLPKVEDAGWFFDTELLLIAQKAGYKVVEIPVEWKENTDTRVRIVSTAWGDLKGLLRLRRELRRGATFDNQMAPGRMSAFRSHERDLS